MTSKNNTKLLLIAAATAVLLGCSKDPEPNNNPDNPDNPTTGFFAENFDGIGPGIKGWKLYGDANKANPLIDKSYNEAWVQREMYMYNGNPDNRMAVSTSFFESPAKADRWLVSPEIEVKGDDPYIYWEEYAPDPQTPQGYAVLVSPDGGVSKESFTEKIYETPNGKSAAPLYVFRSASLAKHKGKKIRLAFLNNWTDGFLISIDNIFLSPSKISSLPNMMSSLPISQTAANVSWKDEALSRNYDLALVPFGGKPTAATHHASNLSYNFTGLNAGSRYHCYVKDPKSVHWIGPYPVQTASPLPLSSDLNGNFLSRGWVIDNLKKEEKSPIDQSPAVFIQGITGDINMGDLISPPIELAAEEPITISYDFYTDGKDGNIIVSIYSMNSGDKGIIIDGFELQDAKIGEKQHRSFTVTPIAKSDVYKISFTPSVFGEKQKDDMRIYLDNVSIKKGK